MAVEGVFHRGGRIYCLNDPDGFAKSRSVFENMAKNPSGTIEHFKNFDANVLIFSSIAPVYLLHFIVIPRDYLRTKGSISDMGDDIIREYAAGVARTLAATRLAHEGRIIGFGHNDRHNQTINYLHGHLFAPPMITGAVDEGEKIALLDHFDPFFKTFSWDQVHQTLQTESEAEESVLNKSTLAYSDELLMENISMEISDEQCTGSTKYSVIRITGRNVEVPSENLLAKIYLIVKDIQHQYRAQFLAADCDGYGFMYCTYLIPGKSVRMEVLFSGLKEEGSDEGKILYVPEFAIDGDIANKYN